MTNKEFAEKNQQFRAACASVKLEATKRQASKWRRCTGLAYKTGRTQ